MEENISKAVIRRLPRYYRYLGELIEEGTEKISSLRMSEDTGLNASQIRRDLNCFGGFGQQGYGYSVEKLRQEIARILGLDRKFNVIIVGAGKIGQALMGYTFTNEGFSIKAIFDNDQEKAGKEVFGKKVMHTDDLKSFVADNSIDIAFLCTPKDNAQSMADYLVSLGIRGIWNFAPVDVCVRKGVSVENVHLSDSLFVLSYMYANEKII